MTNSLAGMWCGSSGQDGNTSGPEPASAFAPPEASVRVKVRGGASRRAVKQAVDTAEAEARAHKVAEQLVDWYNQHVGLSMVQYACLGKGRRIHILDTTHIEVPWKPGRMECSGGQNDDGTCPRLQAGDGADTPR